MPRKPLTERIADKVLDKATRQKRAESRTLRAYLDCWYSTMAYVKLGKYPRGHRHEEHNPLWAWEPTMPEPVRADSNGYTDWVLVRMLPGQEPDEWAQKSQGLAHAFQAIRCRVKPYAPGFVLLEFLRADVLCQMIPAFPVEPKIDLAAIPVGLQEDGRPWTIRLAGSHLLLAGATGSGKSGILWGIIRALLPAMNAGTVTITALDPKHLELSAGRSLFEKYGTYAADPEEIADHLDSLVTEMKARAKEFSGKARNPEPTKDHPARIVIIDELAYVLKYITSKPLRDRITIAISALCTQGRALNYTVIGAVQDPRVDTVSVRHLFPQRCCLRVDSADQVDMVLGQGSRDRGAVCDQIASDPEIGAGVAYVRDESIPEVTRVRAAYVADSDIEAMVSEYA